MKGVVPSGYCLTCWGRQMVEENLPLAIWTIKRSPIGRNLHPDDRDQIAYIGLVRAVAGFNASLGFAFSTYARRCIMSTLTRAQLGDRLIWAPSHAMEPGRAAKRPELAAAAERTRTVSSLSGERQRFRVDPPAPRGPDPDLDGDRRIEALRRAIRGLPDRLRAVIERRLDGETLDAISRDMGVTKERVRQLEKIAHRSLREEMGGSLEAAS